jgi:hypothetical protein
VLPCVTLRTDREAYRQSEYRYRLSRTWSDASRVLFVMMNPSTADPLADDSTVAKCDRFARRWGFGGLDVGNTFAYRATNQGRLAGIADPIGPDNNRHLNAMAEAAAPVVFADGRPKLTALHSRGPAVARMLAAVAEPPCAEAVEMRHVPMGPSIPASNAGAGALGHPTLNCPYHLRVLVA